MLRARGLWRSWAREGGTGAWAGTAAGSGAGNGAERGCGPALGLGLGAEADPGLLRASSPALERHLRGLALVRDRFVSEAEAAELLRELEPLLARRPYQFEHWDGAITGYRETERELGGEVGQALLTRIAGAFPTGRPPQPLIHVLDLHQHGHIRPHIDSVKFCGCTIAGVSLLSPSVMRLQSCHSPRLWLELLLPPGSLYILRGAARYDFTHEILPDEVSFFRGQRVPRGRRVALICRNAPQDHPGNSPAFITGAEAELPLPITDLPPQ